MKAFPLIFFCFLLILTGMPVHLSAGQRMPNESDTLKIYDQLLRRDKSYSIGEPVLIQVSTSNPHENTSSQYRREFVFHKVHGVLNIIRGDSIQVNNEWVHVGDIRKITKPRKGSDDQLRKQKSLSVLGLLIGGPTSIILGVILGFGASGFIGLIALVLILCGICGLLGIIPYLVSTPGVKIGKRFRLRIKTQDSGS